MSKAKTKNSDLTSTLFQTEDGVVVSTSTKDDTLHARVRFAFSDSAPVDALLAKDANYVFAGRSRLARLGIDVRPVSELERTSDLELELDVSIRCLVSQYEVSELVPQALVEGFPIGRLVHCPLSTKLTSKQVFDAYQNNMIKLPAGFSIDREGDIVIRPHDLVYDIAKKLTLDDFLSVTLRKDGKELLNSILIPRRVQDLVIRPGEGVITSCSMFLFEHLVVIDSGTQQFGQHLNSTVLDPYLTSGNRIFIELFNNTDEVVVNPVINASIFNAPTFPNYGPFEARERVQFGDEPYKRLEKHFSFADSAGYFDRHVAIVDQTEVESSKELKVDWQSPDFKGSNALSRLKRGRPIYNHDFIKNDFGTSKIEIAEDDDGGKVILLRFFPNVVEHVDLLHLASENNVKAIVFENASFTHKGYMSARDHSRLADFADMGVQVYWLSREREALLLHSYRGNRGFFCQMDLIEKYKRATVLAVYGSSRDLEENAAPVMGLLTSLNQYFGKNLSIITGGGPGAMLTASENAKEHGMLVGANYLEIEDQKANQIADYFQVFQENSRHSRQRWFEISSFHLFLVGGVGTLEEVGVTLTDMKLGVSSPSPIVFFGEVDGELYWESLIEQMGLMVEDGRVPSWILEHILVTNSVDEVLEFYSQILGVSGPGLDEAI